MAHLPSEMVPVITVLNMRAVTTANVAGAASLTVSGLADLGANELRLMTNNPAKYGGLGGYGLTVVERVSIEIAPTPENEKYLRTKKERLGHLIEMDGK